MRKANIIRLFGTATLLVMAIVFRSSSPVAAQQGTPGPMTRSASEICSGSSMSMGATGTPEASTAGDFDLAFIDLMIPHHEGAIDMATLALERAQHPELKQLANNIIASQSAEIAQMQTWREEWYPGVATLSETQAMEIFNQAAAGQPGMSATPGASGMMMMSEDDMMRLCSAADFDHTFITMMIPHHSGAVVMAQAAEMYATHQEIKNLAADIISAQETEISQMMGWLASWYGVTPSTGDDTMGGMDMTTPMP